MSNYQRLISYLYAYEGETKGKNIGYAKIETRGEQCRIQVNAKKIFVGSNDIGVYLLSQTGETQIGKIFVRNGIGEFRINIASKELEGCFGLTMHDIENTWRSYTTIWEDSVLQTAQIQLQDVTSEKIKEQVEKPQEQEKEEEEIELFPITKEIELELEKETQVEEIVKETDEVQQETKAPDPENPLKLEELEKEEESQAKHSKVWDQMSGKYVKVLAFDYENGCEILSIVPQDIGLLPRETWGYGNNSFLLHGYYNYRHLILARLENPKGAPRYLLGVPGHYFHNEKYMAAMFGFPQFVLAKKQPETDGRFGYWYTDIRL